MAVNGLGEGGYLLWSRLATLCKVQGGLLGGYCSESEGTVRWPVHWPLGLGGAGGSRWREHGGQRHCGGPSSCVHQSLPRLKPWENCTMVVVAVQGAPG